MLPRKLSPVVLVGLVICCGLAAATAQRTDQSLTSEVRTAFQVASFLHVRGGSLKAEQLRSAADKFVEDLDPQRLYFLQGDIDEVKRRAEADIAIDLVVLGRTSVGRGAYDKLAQRQDERLAWIFQQLESPIRTEEQETVRTSRKDAAWFGSLDEADEFWRKLLALDVARLVIAGDTEGEARKKVADGYREANAARHRATDEDIAEMLASKALSFYDPHSAYLAARSLKDLNVALTMNLIGIGVHLRADAQGVTIQEVVPGGPADRSRAIRPLDRIVAVGASEANMVPTRGKLLRDVVMLIRGEKGSRVTLELVRDGEGTSLPHRVTLVRDNIRLDDGRARATVHDVPTLSGCVRVGTIRVDSFYGPPEGMSRGGTSDDVKNLISQLRAAGVQAVVVDLRANGGGMLDEAVKTAGLFVRTGPIVQIKGRTGAAQVKHDRDPGVAFDGPLVVLVSKLSASASEIFAGAMQDYRRAMIVGGASTHGKGTVQTVLSMRDFSPRPIGDSGAVKLTTHKFYRPSGASTQGRGVIPDIQLPSVEDVIARGESDLPGALEWDAIEQSPGITLWGSPPPHEALIAASAERQVSLEEFEALKERIAFSSSRDRLPEMPVTPFKLKAETDARNQRIEEINARLRNAAGDVFAGKILAPEGAAHPNGEVPNHPDVHHREALRVAADWAAMIKSKG